jgi:hypothetical protein
MLLITLEKDKRKSIEPTDSIGGVISLSTVLIAILTAFR